MKLSHDKRKALLQCIAAAAVAAVLTLCSCGGGFASDSPNAGDLGRSIFGTEDTSGRE